MPRGATPPLRLALRLALPGAAAGRCPSTRCASRIRRRSRTTGSRPGSSLPVPRAAKNGGAPTASHAGPSSLRDTSCPPSTPARSSGLIPAPGP
eukprot:5983347-Lingulodinium_polyedra.AAC.1